MKYKHGLIFSESDKYVTSAYNKEVWRDILIDAGLEGKFYDATKPYPDSEVLAILASAVKLSNVPLETHLHQFGEFIVPDLVKVFSHQIKKEWKTLDLLENVETTMHKAVRINNPGATPPELKIIRKDKGTIEILYFSARNLPMLAKGIITGIAKFYGEFDKITIDMKESSNPKGWIFTVKKK